MKFEYDEMKNRANIAKHGLSFAEAAFAFADDNRVIERDVMHSTPTETRYFLYGNTGRGVATVRFTMRSNSIQIIGAGYWPKERTKYEQGQVP
ncbi:MAG: BrnT family toxin [Coriobacteriales bacterium]|nr:BrnT family toxin [Coriobacteriales bacterium]